MSNRLIRSIKVTELFGIYDYDLSGDASLSEASILYGDNGVGKSTILRLAFHLLSPGERNGHRTALRNTSFKYLEVNLSSGITISAKKIGEGEELILQMKIINQNSVEAIWNLSQNKLRISDEWRNLVILQEKYDQIISKKKKDNKSKENEIPEGESIFLEKLKKYAPVIFILNAERRLDSDEVADPGDEIELRMALRRDEPKKINDLVARSREIALSQALNRAQTWVNRRAIRAGNEGSMNVNEVYRNILRQLQSDREHKLSDTNFSDLTKRLGDIETKTEELSKYELQTPLSTEDFQLALKSAKTEQSVLAAKLIEPYIESLEARIKALNPTYEIVDQFVGTINRLLNDKNIKYSLTSGFSIYNIKGDKLDVANLSSGEQQLLLLFSYVLTARDKPTVFMIDEPEISLNIKWQRQLVRDLLNLTKGSSTQFILATHSLELLAQHRNRVIRVGN